MIPVADPRLGVQRHRAEILAAIERVLDSGQYILGPEVERFEKRFAETQATRHAVGVGNGTDAIQLALRAVGVGPGDEVITVSHTAIATVAAVCAIGATPVLVDIEPDTYTMDPAQLPAALSPTVKAILPVHLYGHPADMDPILAFAAENDLKVVEDCAQAHGATYRGRPVGSMGDAGSFSFYPTKNLAAIGDGGAVVTNDDEVAERLALLRQYGWKERNNSLIEGVNSRLDEMQAAILNVRLDWLEDEMDQRTTAASAYGQALAHSMLKPPLVRQGSKHAYHLYVIRSEDRASTKEKLAAEGIQTAVHYPVPAHLQSGFLGRIRIGPSLEETETASSVILSLPMHPWLSPDEVRTVAQALSRASPATSLNLSGVHT